MSLYGSKGMGTSCKEIIKHECGGEGAGRAPSPAPEDQSAQVRAFILKLFQLRREHPVLANFTTEKFYGLATPRRGTSFYGVFTV